MSWPGPSPPTSQERVAAEGVRIVHGSARLVDPQIVAVGDQRIEADVVLIATGATPRVLPSAEPDGERILNWRQLYELPELPEHLIVVGSGVTGAEFAAAYLALGSRVTLVSSRDHVLPNEDEDAARVLEDVFQRRGMELLARSRAAGVRRLRDGVEVTLTDGRKVEGSHCLMTVGMVPNTQGLGLGGGRRPPRRAAASSRSTRSRGRPRPTCTPRATARAC